MLCLLELVVFLQFLIVQEPVSLNHQQVVLLVVLFVKTVRTIRLLVLLKFVLVFVVHPAQLLVVQVPLNFAVLL